MRKLARASLSPGTMGHLAQRTQQVLLAADPKQEAARLWDSKANEAFREVRIALDQIASGLGRCMYCEDSRGTDIEHFWPKSTYPAQAFLWDNYLLACSGCNSNHKREQFPLDAAGHPLLIDPTAEEPRDHLLLMSITGEYKHLTIKGEESVRVFHLNRADLMGGRRNAWEAIQGLLVFYGQLCLRGDSRRALLMQRTLCEYPFSSVFGYLLQVVKTPDAALLIEEECLKVLDKYPDIKGWL
jgi:uncharacterized protein (TIGR02646 family)